MQEIPDSTQSPSSSNDLPGASAPLGQESWVAARPSSATPLRPAGGETLARAASGAHRAVDSTVEKVAPVIDAVHDKVESAKASVQGAKDQANKLRGDVQQARDAAAEWIGAARDAVREHPLAAMAGAFLVGIAIVSVTSNRR
jgi:hypothetical protein